MFEPKTVSKNDPRISRILLSSFPDYKGRRPVRVYKCSVHSIQDYWDGGSRSYAAVIGLDYRQRSLNEVGFEKQTQGNWFNLPLGTINMGADFVVVEHNIFCGKDMGISVYGSEEALNKLGLGDNQ